MTMLEKVANAIQGPTGLKTADAMFAARRAIEVMRDPSLDMCRAYGPDFLVNGAIWQTMIDAALKETP